jgi:hypothetical protein
MVICYKTTMEISNRFFNQRLLSVHTIDKSAQKKGRRIADLNFQIESLS